MSGCRWEAEEEEEFRFYETVNIPSRYAQVSVQLCATFCKIFTLSLKIHSPSFFTSIGSLETYGRLTSSESGLFSVVLLMDSDAATAGSEGILTPLVPLLGTATRNIDPSQQLKGVRGTFNNLLSGQRNPYWLLKYPNIAFIIAALLHRAAVPPTFLKGPKPIDGFQQTLDGPL